MEQKSILYSIEQDTMYREYKVIFTAISMCLSGVYCDNTTETQIQWTPRLIAIVSLAILLLLSYISTCVLIAIIARLCYVKRELSQNTRRLMSVYENTHAKNNRYEADTIKSHHIYETLQRNTIYSENRSMPIFNSPINYKEVGMAKTSKAIESVMEQDQVESNYTKCIEVIA